MGGNAVSSPQQKFCQELHYLLTKNSYETPLKEVEDLAKEIAEICPRFPLAGMLDLQKWDKIGYCLRNHPKVNFKVRHTWFQVRACLQGPTPDNPLLAIKSLPSPLPIILPPKPASWLIEAPKAPPPVSTALPALPSAPLPACPALEFPSQLPDSLPEPSPALSIANDGKLLSAGFVDAVPAAALAIEPVHLASPVLQATAPAQAGKNAPIPSEALKAEGLQAPFTHSLLEGLALQKLLLKAWSRIPAKTDSNVAGLAAVHQGAKEFFAEFVSHLIVAFEEQVGTTEVWITFPRMLCISIIKQLAFENSNAGCKLAVATFSGSSTISLADILRACQFVSTDSDKVDDGGGGGMKGVNEMWNSNHDEEKKSRLKQGSCSTGEAASINPPWEKLCFPSFRKGVSTDTVAMPCLDSLHCFHPLNVVVA